MMAEQLPAPGLARRRLAEEAEIIAPLAQDLRRADEIAEETVELHHVMRAFHALGAEARAQHLHHRVACCLTGLFEAQPVILEEQLGVLPAPPGFGLDRKAARPALACAHEPQELPRRIGHRRDRRAFGRELEKPGDDLPLGGDALEGLGQKLRPGGEELLPARRLTARLGMGARARAGDLRLRGRRQEGSIIGVIGHGTSPPSRIRARDHSAKPPPARRTQASGAGCASRIAFSVASSRSTSSICWSKNASENPGG